MNFIETQNDQMEIETPNIKICGLVTTTEGIVFNLNCLFCSEVSDDYIEFIAHINTNHLNNLLYSQEQHDPTTETKLQNEELSATCEPEISKEPSLALDQNSWERDCESDDMTSLFNEIKDEIVFSREDDVLFENQHTNNIQDECNSSEEKSGGNENHADMPNFEMVKVASDTENDLELDDNSNCPEEETSIEAERKKIIYLINLYKQYPNLWDLRDINHTNSSLKSKAYVLISKEMSRKFNHQIKPKTIKNIILSLRSQLKREMQRMSKSDTATSNLWFYDMLSFILVGNDLGNQKIEYLIDLYKEFPVLWDTNISGNRDSISKHNAYIKIAEAMNEKYNMELSAQNIKHKILNLCCQFRKETQNMSAKGIKTSNLWFYDRLSFILNHKSSRKERSLSTKENEYLIELYKQYPFLWDHRRYDKKHATARNEAFEEISKSMKEKFKEKLVTTNVRLKITQLRSSFYLELHDMLKSQRSTPRLKVFDQLSFIMLGDMDSMNKFEDENDENVVSCSQAIDISSLLEFHKDKEINSDFIDLYKSVPCLWNKQSSDYEDYEQCKKAHAFLIKSIKEKWEIHLSEEEILQKISIMKFLNNTIKINNKSECSEDGSQEPWYYDKLDFLEKKKRGNRNHQHKCEICQEIFLSQRKLQNHLNNDHNVDSFICKICKKIFQAIHLLKLHEKTHVDFENRPFSCQFCDAKFAVKATLTEHERRHTKTFLHQCEVCLKKFISRSEKLVHSRTHTGEKRYLCDECGQSFQSSSTLAVHQRSHSGDRPYKCTICPMAFFNSSILKRHLKSHTNIRDHICNVCGKGFKFRSTLLQHALLHSKEKKYSCKICMKRFSQYGGLHGHMKTHGIAPVEVSENMFVNETEFPE